MSNPSAHLQMKFGQTWKKSQPGLGSTSSQSVSLPGAHTALLESSFIFGNDHQIIAKSLHKQKDEPKNVAD